MKRAEGNYLTASRVRTEYADRLFKPDTIAAAIDEAAMVGWRHYRVVQELPFDLSDTEAAKALEMWLDTEQFHYAWRPTFIQRDPARLSPATEYPELVITW